MSGAAARSLPDGRSSTHLQDARVAAVPSVRGARSGCGGFHEQPQLPLLGRGALAGDERAGAGEGGGGGLGEEDEHRGEERCPESWTREEEQRGAAAGLTQVEEAQRAKH